MVKLHQNQMMAEIYFSRALLFFVNHIIYVLKMRSKYLKILLVSSKIHPVIILDRESSSQTLH